MWRIGIAGIVLAVLTACDRDVSGSPCQQACDITNPGLTGISCQPEGTCHAANDYGLCLCTVDAKCPTGMVPWDPAQPGSCSP